MSSRESQTKPSYLPLKILGTGFVCLKYDGIIVEQKLPWILGGVVWQVDWFNHECWGCSLEPLKKPLLLSVIPVGL